MVARQSDSDEADYAATALPSGYGKSVSDVETEDNSQEPSSHDHGSSCEGFPEVILQLLPNLACVLGECGKVRRRPRQKVNVPTTDKHGFPLSQTEVSRLRRRMTNRDSSRRMRELRQSQMRHARQEVQALVKANARMAERLAALEADSPLRNACLQPGTGDNRGAYDMAVCKPWGGSKPSNSAKAAKGQGLRLPEMVPVTGVGMPTMDAGWADFLGNMTAQTLPPLKTPPASALSHKPFPSTPPDLLATSTLTPSCLSLGALHADASNTASSHATHLPTPPMRTPEQFWSSHNPQPASFALTEALALGGINLAQPPPASEPLASLWFAPEPAAWPVPPPARMSNSSTHPSLPDYDSSPLSLHDLPRLPGDWWPGSACI